MIAGESGPAEAVLAGRDAVPSLAVPNSTLWEKSNKNNIDLLDMALQGLLILFVQQAIVRIE